MKPNVLTLINTESGTPLATLGLVAYDGSKVTKRDGTVKTMVFSSGKHGFFAGGKITLDGKVYQCSASFVEIANQPVNGAVRSFTAEQIAAMNAQRESSESDGEKVEPAVVEPMVDTPAPVIDADKLAEEELERLTAPNAE